MIRKQWNRIARRRQYDVSALRVCRLFVAGLALLLFPAADSNSEQQDWTNYVRIAAYGLKSDNAAQIVESAQRDDVFGIEVDNDIEGRYESFLHPEEKLKAIHAVAVK